MRTRANSSWASNGLQAPHLGADVFLAGEHDDGHVRKLRAGLFERQKFEAIQDRHDEIAQNEIHRLLHELLEAGDAVTGGEHAGDFRLSLEHILHAIAYGL
jgi:hypothetical protein